MDINNCRGVCSVLVADPLYRAVGCCVLGTAKLKEFGRIFALPLNVLVRSLNFLICQAYKKNRSGCRTVLLVPYM